MGESYQKEIIEVRDRRRENVGWDERWKTERMKGQVKMTGGERFRYLK